MTFSHGVATKKRNNLVVAVVFFAVVLQRCYHYMFNQTRAVRARSRVTTGDDIFGKPSMYGVYDKRRRLKFIFSSMNE